MGREGRPARASLTRGRMERTRRPPMAARIIAKVDDDWHPPDPDTSPEVKIDAEQGREKRARAEEGQENHGC